jgi:Holliday junction DNA helicase RuvA
MISKLKGVVEASRDGFVILDVGGVGYGVTVPARTSASNAAGSPLALWIETVVREDAISLYGFETEAEHELFNLLTTVQGVGPKAAMSVLSALAAKQIVAAIASGDAKTLSSAPGIGAKTAARIASELKDKIAKAGVELALERMPSGKAKSSLAEDAVSALVNLGYTRTQSFEAVMRIAATEPDAALDGLIKSALRELGSL